MKTHDDCRVFFATSSRSCDDDDDVIFAVRVAGTRRFPLRGPEKNRDEDPRGTRERFTRHGYTNERSNKHSWWNNLDFCLFLVQRLNGTMTRLHFNLINVYKYLYCDYSRDQLYSTAFLGKRWSIYLFIYLFIKLFMIKEQTWAVYSYFLKSITILQMKKNNFTFTSYVRHSWEFLFSIFQFSDFQFSWNCADYTK